MKSWTEWPDDDLRPHKQRGHLDRCRSAGGCAVLHLLHFLFFRQWAALRGSFHPLGIRIIGDLPIYVAMDSADIWAEPKLFQLDDHLVPTSCLRRPA